MSDIDDVLPLPEEVDVRLLCPDIIVLSRIVPWGAELIQLAEKIGLWIQSGQVRPGEADALYQDVNRTSNSCMISSNHPDYGPCLRRFEAGLLRAFHTGALAYLRYNRKLVITDDTGYELLRYEKGQHFEEHVDTIVGRHEGFRQLSGLLYLNDDYEGGETLFPRHGIKFKACAGDLLLFPSNFCYPHAALPITKGTKYAVVTWFVAYPVKPQGSGEEEGQDDEAEAVDDAGDIPSAPGNERVCVYESAGSGSSEGEPRAPGREHPACTGGSTRQGHEA